MANTWFTKACDRLGLGAIYAAGAGFTLSTAAGEVGMVLALLMFMVSASAWRWAIRQPLFWISLLAIVFIYSAAWAAAGRWPSTAGLQWERAADWSRLFWFLPIAWHLRTRNSVYLALGIMAMAFLLSSTFAWIQSADAISDTEYGRFGGALNKPIVTAFYASMVVVGVLVFLPKLLEGCARRRCRFGVLAVAGVVLTAGLLIIVASASRGPVLTLLVTVPALLLALWLRGRRTESASRRSMHLTAVGVALVMGVVTAFSLNESALSSRISFGMKTLLSLSETNAALKADDGVMHRLNMWRFGLHQWRERKWVGYGPGSVEHVQRAAGDQAPPTAGEPWDNMHSAYVQALFDFGIVGVVLFGAALALLARGGWAMWRRHKPFQYEGLFVLAGIGLVAVYSLTDFRHLNHDWRLFWTVFAAAAVALARQSEAEAAVPPGTASWSADRIPLARASQL